MLHVSALGIGLKQSFIKITAKGFFEPTDETALAVLARVAGVSDKSTRGDFVNWLTCWTNKLQIKGLTLTLIGVVVMVSKGSIETLLLLTFNNGDFLMLFGCLFYAAYAIGLKNRPKVSGLVMLGYFSVAAFLMTIPLMAIESAVYGTVMPGAKGWLIIIYIAVVPSFISQIFFMRGVDLIGSGSAGLYANLVPVFSAIIAVILLSEVFSIYHLSAMIFVFGGIGLFEYQNLKKP